MFISLLRSGSCSKLMRLSSLKLINFRNYGQLELNFNAMINVFFGANAQGKTNLLEALYYSAFGLSHRTSREDELLKFGQEALAVAVEFYKDEEPHNLRLKRLQEQGRFKKIILLDGKKTTSKEHYGFLNLVMFSPEDLQIVKGDPALRRRFLDMEIAQTDPVYYDLLLKYNKSLRQRNRLLKQIREENGPAELLTTWDGELAVYGSEILAKRLQNLHKLSLIGQKILNSLTASADAFTIKYQLKGWDDVFLTADAFLTYGRDYWQDFYRRKLLAGRRKDLLLGYTGVGTHRDDLVFYINEHDSRSFASQGQQRSCALALKLAQVEYVRQICGEFPVMLLDDVMSELDEVRRLQLLKFIDGRVQTFITVNDRFLIPDLPKTDYFQVQTGSVQPFTCSIF